MWNDIRNIIKEHRERKNLSQTDLAAMIGKEQSYVYCVESGQIKISEEIVIEMSSALNIDMRKELYHIYKEEFERKINCNIERKFPVSNNDSKRISNENIRIKTSEKKTQPTQLLIKPSTKLAIADYAEKNNTSTNDVLESLAISYIKSHENGEVLCQYAGITFNPVSNVGMRKGEKKSVRLQLLLKESTKNGIKEIAEENGTSLNSIIHKLADSFLWEYYR